MRPLEAFISRFSNKKILVIGDVMLDRFVWGNVSRISPEAPVPIVNVEKEAVYPGGAANVARNLVPFASEVYIVGQMGQDQESDTLIGTLQEGGIHTSGMLRNIGCATITKTRIIARKQQVVRIDRERITRIGRQHVEQVRQFVLERLDEFDGLIVSDYGKGFVTQELVDAVIPIAQAAGLVVTVDPNPENRLRWRGVTSIKPNRAEAFLETGIAETLWTAESDPLEDEVVLRVGQILLEHWDTEMVQMTLGELGMILFEREGKTHHVPALAREVFDVSGAGDTAIAFFTLSLTAGATPVQAAEISNCASAVVVGKLGTATLSPDELLESIGATPGTRSTLERLSRSELVASARFTR